MFVFNATANFTVGLVMLLLVFCVFIAGGPNYYFDQGGVGFVIVAYCCGQAFW